MTDRERTAVLQALEESRAEMLNTLEAFPEDRFQDSPGSAAWSACQTLEHIVLVESRALGRIRMALAEPADSSRHSALPPEQDAALWEGVKSRAVKVQAPPVLHCPGGKTKEELLTAFLAARETTIEFAKTTTADLRHSLANHPLFGDLDCYQWLGLIPAHGERHRKQIEEIRALLPSAG